MSDTVTVVHGKNGYTTTTYSTTQTIYNSPHEAISVIFDEPVTSARGAEIIKTYQAAIEGFEGKPMPLWLAFADFYGSKNVNWIIGEAVPYDVAALDALLLAIPEARRVRHELDCRRGPWCRKRQVVRPPKPKKVDGFKFTSLKDVSAPPNPINLPISLRFLACEEAMKETRKIAEIYDRFPWFGFNDEQLNKASQWRAETLAESYPYLAAADDVIGGGLREVIKALGKRPDVHRYDLHMYFIALKAGDFANLKKRSASFIAEITGGAGDTTRWLEEEASPKFASNVSPIRINANSRHWSDGHEYSAPED